MCRNLLNIQTTISLLKAFFLSIGILILGILMYVLIFGIFDSVEDMIEPQVVADFDVLNMALSRFQKENGFFPRDLEHLEGKYLVKMGADPWGSNYIYIVNDSGYTLACCEQSLIKKYEYQISENGGVAH